VRLKDGKIVEHWAVADVLAMMEQLGAIEYKTNN
jgi:predicted ester cyclase